MDSEGRVPIPEELRRELGLEPGEDVELRRDGCRLEMEPAVMAAHLEDHDGWIVIVADNDVATVTGDELDAALELLRTEVRGEAG